ncbi:Uncharacterised protein [Schaalia odontolytica]|uniref:Uncharacterized protein n=1 Tax=Schaalia odontolytica TaxID=1660 RepID=A0A6N2SI14_9ACTO
MSSGAHAAERLIERRFVAHRLDDAVGAQAVGQFFDAGDALLAALFDNVSCTEWRASACRSAWRDIAISLKAKNALSAR